MPFSSSSLFLLIAAKKLERANQNTSALLEAISESEQRTVMKNLEAAMTSLQLSASSQPVDESNLSPVSSWWRNGCTGRRGKNVGEYWGVGGVLDIVEGTGGWVRVFRKGKYGELFFLYPNQQMCNCYTWLNWRGRISLKFSSIRHGICFLTFVQVWKLILVSLKHPLHKDNWRQISSWQSVDFVSVCESHIAFDGHHILNCTMV